ncbi:putative E3 ubiquitin-protein ligase HERC4 [Ciona intestinalis]
MYAWGKSIIGKSFGNGANLQVPTEINCFGKTIIKSVRVSRTIAVFLLEDGTVHTFGAENDNIGHAAGSTKVSALETVHIVDIALGDSHILAIDDKGKVYGWGGNDKDQLGWTDGNCYPSPKKIKSLSNKIVQVACGHSHSLFLGSNGALWSAGNNNYGQLGFGDKSSTELRPLISLKGIPFSQISAGFWHSFCVTHSGAVFCWGRNDNGQLGLADCVDRNVPVLLKALRSLSVKYICAGELHTAALTLDGGVFTFGSNQFGQLGHGSSGPEPLPVSTPRKIFELMGNEVTQIACGAQHTICYVGKTGNVYTFGNNDYSQLGYIPKHPRSEFVPHPLSSDMWTCSASTSSYPKLNSVFVKEIGAGKTESFISVSTRSNSSDFRRIPTHQQIFTLSDEFISKLQSLENTKITPDVANYLETIMGSQSCINASFLASDHYKTSNSYHGISLMSVRLRFSKLCKCSCKDVQSIMVKSMQSSLLPSIARSQPDIETLRVFVLLPECDLFTNSENYGKITFPFANLVMSLDVAPSKILDRWYRAMEPLYFARPIDIYKQSIKNVLDRPHSVDARVAETGVRSALDFLGKLNTVNNTGEVPIVPYQRFYLPEITKLINLEDDYVRWLRGNSQVVIFCNYPFLLNSVAKSSLLHIDAVWQMRAAYSEAQDRNMASLFSFSTHAMLETPVLELEVRRSDLLQDALNRLAMVDVRSFKKPLMVKFDGEEGQDEGGVRKEFFMLILKEVLDPKYGMFRFYDESHLIWFSDWELESEMMYFLVGLICGLAIYNDTIIDICFPLVLYKKLLGEPPLFTDLAELDPTLSRSMNHLLEYQSDVHSIEDTFCLNFTVSRDNFGETTEVDLIAGGSNIPVTADNRKEYVQSYINHLFNTSVQKKFEAFNKGFHKVCGGKILQLFRATELMEMVVGNQNYNWEEFEKSADYKGEYYRQHPVIRIFWRVFHKFSLEEKKDFLLFLTGSNKIPITGVKIIIQPVKTSENHLPVAHTCFNLLDLPYYTTEHIMDMKLKQAMLNNQGFYLI